MKLRLTLAVVLLLAIGLGYSVRTNADAPAQSITISPTSIDESVNPGSVTDGSFKIINSGSGNYTFKVYATPYRVTGEDYSPDFTPIAGAPNIISWLHFSTTSATVNTSQIVTVNYTISVPAGTPAGGYYATAFAQTQPEAASTSGVVVTDRVGEIFYLRVAGNARQSGKLLSWQTSFLQKPPVMSVVRIEDNGAYNFPTDVNVKIKNIFGHTVYSFETTRQILPQTIRRIKIPWAASPSIGVFKIAGTAQLLDHTYPLSTKYVLVMSQSIRLGLLAFIIVVLIFVIYRRFRHHGKRRF